MSDLTKKEKLELVITNSEKYGITAYEFGKNTTLTDVGAHKILTGKSKNPHENTIQTMFDYMQSTLLNNKQITQQTLQEDTEPYTKEKSIDDIIYERVRLRLQKDIDHLQNQINELKKNQE